MAEDKKIGQEYGKVRHALDEEKLNKYLTENVSSISTPVEIKQFAYGQSNPTYFLTDTKGIKYVLRKKPPGDLLSPTAHAVEREHKVITALGKHNETLKGGKDHKDAVPVPKTFCLCTDESVIGTPFYVMEFVQGRIFSDIRMLQISKKERIQCWRSALETLAALHRLSPKDLGLETYGKPSGFYNRQLKTFAGISKMQAQATDQETGKEVGQIPGFERMVKWLTENMVEDENTIAHGDFKIDNLIFSPTEPKVIAVLDWELSTLGHPLADLSNLTQPFSLDCSEPSKVLDEEWGKKETFMVIGGLPDDDSNPLPSKEWILKTYCEFSGRKYPIKGWGFCEAWAWFRNTIIAQGIAARVAMGQASSAEAKLYASKMPVCAECVHTLIDKAEREKSGKAKL